MKTMKAIRFKNMTGYATGKGYFDLPIYKNRTQYISCWKIPFLQRFKLLVTGKIWLFLEHGRQPEELKKLFNGKNYHQPVNLSTEYPFEEIK